MNLLVKSGNCTDSRKKNLCRAGWRASLACLALLTAGLDVLAQNNVTTQHYDIARTGANTNETILTPNNVNSTTFGKLFSHPVDGRIFAQPLYMGGITMGGGTPQAGTQHNVVYVATEHDGIYAFDADNNTGANASPLWQITLLDAAHGAAPGATTIPNGNLGTGDISPEIGITGTPVIDPSTNTLYVVGKTLEGSTYVQRLHSIDITTGNEKLGGPINLSAQVPGTGTGSSGGILHWDPEWENNRPGLLLLNGIVYLGFASHGDNGPWHGWILAYNATTLTQTGAWCSSPNGNGDGIWMGGTGLAADVPDPVNHPYGRIFTATGNGAYNAVAPGYTNAMNYGDSIIKLDLTNGSPTMVTSGGTTVGDDFTPHDQASLNGADEDVASGGVILLPDSIGGGGGQRQLVQVGKSGRIYVLNRENLGGYNSANTKDPQEAAYIDGLWGAPAYWNGNIYVWGNGDHLRAFSFANGVMAANSSSSSAVTSYSYSPTPSVSSNGNINGIVWAIRTDSGETNAVLYAYDATNLATELYDSSQNSSRDVTGAKVKFIVPTVINGKVYDGSQTELDVFGLLNGAVQAAKPNITPGTQTFPSSLQVTMTDSSAGTTIYYTTDGSIPTTNSQVYIGPVTITSTTTVNAVASGGGFLTSPTASVTYTLQTQAAIPTFNPASGTYSTGQYVTLNTTTSNATVYYTTDGTTPTTSSNKYTGPVFVGLTETLSAIATGSGLTNSPAASGLYTINSSGTGADFSSGFGSALTYMTFNGSTGLDDIRLQLTSGVANQAGSAWYNTPVGIKTFVNDFTFQISNAGGEGIAFVIQNAGLNTLGPNGSGLGYGAQTSGGTGGIPLSVAIKFDEVNNAGEGTDSTGLYINGASPTTPFVDLSSSGILVSSGDTISVHMVYDGTTLTMTLTDPVVNKTFTTSWTIDIPTTVGNGTAYVGFTGATSALTSSQKIGLWTFSSTSAQPMAGTPIFSLASGPYLGTQTVSISDASSGSSLFYTLDGTKPATSAGGSTMAYAGAITVSATETINALATASGYTASPIASATYTIEAQVAAPTFSPGAGTYTSAQTVTIATTSPNATIYYTTNGTTPTTSSAVYSGQIAVTTSQTIKAMAVASGYFNSNVSSAAYTINSGSGSTINLGSGFLAGSMTLNGFSTLNGARLRLTDGGGTEASSAWYTVPVNIQQFSTNFSFQITGGTTPTADGFTFAIQGGPSTAIGPSGGGLGYGGTNGITNSVAVKFDLYSNAGEGVDSTGLYTNGASPMTPAVDMTSSGVNLHTTDVFNVGMTYDGTNLTMTITDANTNATFTNTWPINIPGTVGGNTALVGFTGGTGGQTAIQEIIGWTLSSTTSTPAATPTFSPLGGTYTSAQNVTINDATSGAKIYYTTNGITPTSGSTLYSGAISVNASETIQAIAVASGFSNSAVGSAAYTINLPAAATPTFTPAGGTYNSAQSVTISDATSGAKIYYTTNGTTPTTGSTVYAGPIAVAGSETIQAIAVASGFSNSAVGSAAYTINLPAATPTFSPLGGTYTSAQNITISDATSGAKIYYTTNGTTPTTSSTLYSGPIAVNTSETIQAIAAASGFSNSAAGSATYTINSNTGSTINLGNGFAPGSMLLNGSGLLNGTRLRLTDASTTYQVASAYYNTAVNIQQFTTNFSFQITGGTNPTADGFTFIIQGGNSTAIGPAGGGLGYGPAGPGGTPGIGKSVAVKFDLYNNAGEGVDSTGLYTNGASPTTPAVDMTSSGVNLHTTDVFNVGMTYDGTNLTMSITDASTNANFSHTWPINIPGTVGANTALVGFTAGTGGQTAIQEIIGWTLSSSTASPAATPTFSPAGGTYNSAQSVTISDTTAGAAIYYTTNGTTPTTGSTLYGGPVAVNASETIQAVAVATGLSNSSIGSATYTINLPAAATPTFSPAGGTYTSAQSVTISDTTTGAAIYYTTNGTTPTAGSTKYTGPIAVTGSETIQAIAVASGYSNSAIGSAAYTINLPAAATPTFSPVAGTYNSSQSVAITDTTSGATIYYTTNGATPTTGSTAYSGPINVVASQTVNAIAVASGFSTSAVGSAAYTITGGIGFVINYGGGFTGSGLSLNGGAAINGTRLRLTNGSSNLATSAWGSTPVNVQTFSTDFTFQLASAVGDGFTFAIQNAGATAVGLGGGGLGYSGTSGTTGGIPHSLAVKFDLVNNSGEGNNSIGLYLNGAAPTMPAITLGNGINLHSGDTFAVHFNYDGTTLSMRLTDTVTPSATLTYAWIINIPTTIGSNTAYVGFTAGTGASTATDDIITWTFGNSFTPTKAIINYQTSLLTALSSGPTFRTFAYVNFPDSNGTILDATKVGDSVTLTVNIPAAGTYDIRTNFKYFSTRGIGQLSINGTNIGAPFDEYAPIDTNGLVDFGTFSFGAAGNYPFKFTVTGKNAGSTGYSISFDDLTLSQQ